MSDIQDLGQQIEKLSSSSKKAALQLVALSGSVGQAAGNVLNIMQNTSQRNSQEIINRLHVAQAKLIDAVASLEAASASAEKWLSNHVGVPVSQTTNVGRNKYTSSPSSNFSKADAWNTDNMPLVRANIRRSVELYFSQYVSEDKLEHCLEALSFMDQDELAKRYGRGFQRGTLGFNDGDTSNIACDIKGVTIDGRVGDRTVSGSGNININFAFVTAVHENLHMMSANDTPSVIKRGIMVGGDEQSRAMNEAFTEYFTFLSCGGDTPLGGLYPGVYSGYQILMQEMPTIEKAVGRDCMMDAYFNNNPQRMREAIDSLLGPGAWDDMCTASYDLLYHDNANGGAARLVDYFKQLSDV